MLFDLNINFDESFEPFKNHILYTYNILLKEILDIFTDMPIQFVYGEYLNNEVDLKKATIQIIPSNFFREESYLSSESLPSRPTLWIDAAGALVGGGGVCDSRLPVLFLGEGKRDFYIKKENNVLITNADLIASAFFMLTRYEEIIIDESDEYERFPFVGSFAYKEGFIDRPIVNEYAELLWGWILAMLPQGRRNRKAYQVRLTHDVDRFRKYGSISRELRISASLAIKHQEPFNALNHLTGMIKTRFGCCKDPYDSYDALMDISENLGGKGCFYFMAEEAASPDKRYEVTNKDVVTVIKKIIDRGHEIGLHPGIGSYRSLEKLHHQKEKLDKVLGYSNYGGRQHYLQWRAPDTWRLYEKVGLTHDSSVGYVEMPGFRCGMCMPFKVFDALAGKKLNVKEIPLITMDTSLFSSQYSKLQYENMKDELLKAIKQNIKKVRGIYCLLWHNASPHKYGDDVLNNLISNHI
jgi:hypothetical protein